MKEYNEQVVETLDDAGCIIANKNIIIDNLQARIAELEGDVAIERASRKYWEDAYSEWINTDKAAQGLIAKDERIAELEAENARLKAAVEYAETIRVENIAYFEKQLAASQLSETQLRGALQTYIDEHEECQDADDWMAMMCSMEAHHAADEALSQPSDTSALVSFVAEEVKDVQLQDIEQYRLQMAGISTAAIGYWKEDDSIHPDYDTPALRDVAKLYANYESRTRQRDLAVEALEDVRKELQQSNDRLYEEREIWDRVMGDGVKKLERLDLELDDCLYVLESLWDKTCNKEVTEKWAGILIRNKRGIGASSAEDSSEQTTA